MTAEIQRWAIPDEGWLRIDVVALELPMTESFYRVKDPAVMATSTRLGKPETWDWFQWSMAGKPTVKVGRDPSAVLDDLVLRHPVLGRIADQFGY